MHALSFLFAFGSMPLVAFAGQTHQDAQFYHKRQVARSTTCTPSNATKSAYKLADLHQGKTFFDGWDFFSGADPTSGNVVFLSQNAASSQGLAVVQSDNTTVIAVDSTSVVPKGGNRNSVRISTKNSYSSGLFIADFGAMPTGCGVWPAWWSLGPQWPAAGEIDIIEGVNNQKFNQYTAHSGSAGGNCTLDTANSDAYTSNLMGLQCLSANGDNAGCGFADTSDTSFGAGFNAAKGGVFAHLWDSAGIKIWRFTRASIPADITSMTPNPNGWGTPAAAWSSATCDIAAHFYDHVLTLDTTICGDWAGDAYGQSQCPGTCSDMVANATNFVDAKWKVNYIAVYQS